MTANASWRTRPPKSAQAQRSAHSEIQSRSLKAPSRRTVVRPPKPLGITQRVFAGGIADVFALLHAHIPLDFFDGRVIVRALRGNKADCVREQITISTREQITSSTQRSEPLTMDLAQAVYPLWQIAGKAETGYCPARLTRLSQLRGFEPRKPA